MNFMISCRHPLTILKQANEIRVDYKDINRIADFITPEWTSEAQIIIYIPKDEIVDWEKITAYQEVLNIVIAVEDTNIMDFVKTLNFPVFWSYPVTTYWELNGLLNLGVSQVLLDAPLFFDLEKVKNICGDGVELRAIVNKCYNNYMTRKDGICGTYIRPEDITMYSKYINHFEFDAKNLTQERILYNVYTKDTFWPDNLNILLTNFNVNVNNRGFEGLPEPYHEKSFAERRMNCKQICQQDPYRCKFCYTVIDFINAVQKKMKSLDNN